MINETHPGFLPLVHIKTKEEMIKVIHNWLSSEEAIQEYCPNMRNPFCLRHRMDFRTDVGTLLNLGIQASSQLYCTPRKTSLEYGFYSDIQVDYPSWTFSHNVIKTYAENTELPCGTVYPYIPIEVVAEELLKAVRTL